jgi:crotonobetainyl-CoA:carnitine CoA-transferase CaiB-like acyl-CoA transferase
MAPTLGDIVGRIIPTDTTGGWLEQLRAADIFADRVNGFDDWLADPHIVATGGGITVEHLKRDNFRHREHRVSRFGWLPHLPPAPRVGEHGADILAEIGIDPTAIARLRAENILLIPEAS